MLTFFGILFILLVVNILMLALSLGKVEGPK